MNLWKDNILTLCVWPVTMIAICRLMSKEDTFLHFCKVQNLINYFCTLRKLKNDQKTFIMKNSISQVGKTHPLLAVVYVCKVCKILSW